MTSRCRHCALNFFSPHAPPSGATRDNQTDERARTRCCIEKLGEKFVLPRTNKIVRSETGIKKNLFRPVKPLTEKFQLSPLFSFIAWKPRRAAAWIIDRPEWVVRDTGAGFQNHREQLASLLVRSSAWDPCRRLRVGVCVSTSFRPFYLLDSNISVGLIGYWFFVETKDNTRVFLLFLTLWQSWICRGEGAPSCGQTLVARFCSVFLVRSNPTQNVWLVLASSKIHSN